MHENGTRVFISAAAAAAGTAHAVFQGPHLSLAALTGFTGVLYKVVNQSTTASKQSVCGVQLLNEKGSK